MKVLVTGGAGFIGSHITEVLCDNGHEVSVFDDLSTGYEDYLDKRANFIKANLNERKILEDSLEGKDVVIHLAAESIIKYSIEDPEKILKRNINNLINLLEAMRKKNVRFIIFSSSASVYGEPKEAVPVKEEYPKNPLHPYGGSKLACEDILSSYYNTFGINSICLRYFNVYGPRDDQLPVTRAVPNWIKAILTDKPIRLFWKGQQKRDYLFVKDLAKAHIAVLGRKGFHVYNVGSGGGYLVKEILEMIFKVTDKKTLIIDAGERQGDPNFLVADIFKIKKEVGWQPETSLENGIKQTYEFYKNHPSSLERI